MSEYIIFTDSACDIDRATLDKWGVKYCSLLFTFNDSEKEYSNYDMEPKDFYEKMRNGAVAKTSAANAEAFKKLFEPELQKGNDILYLAFSSGLSTTVNSASIAVDDLKEKYPDRRVVVVDSLSASAGYGLLLYLTVEQKRAGATIDEAEKFIKDTRLHVCHWFTVDNLVYLKRGGRISPTAALVGSVLGIKPVLHMDNDGHLINMSKVRGRRASISAIVDKYGELAITPTEGTVFISHGDCPEDAETLKNMVKQKYGVKVAYIADIGPVIGAHSGPGTLALFFLGKER